MKRILIACAVTGALAGTAFAKLPAPPPQTDAQKAEAAEKKQVADAKDADLLAKSQDKAVAHYKKTKGGVQAQAAPVQKKK